MLLLLLPLPLPLPPLPLSFLFPLSSCTPPVIVGVNYQFLHTCWLYILLLLLPLPLPPYPPTFSHTPLSPSNQSLFLPSAQKVLPFNTKACFVSIYSCTCTCKHALWLLDCVLHYVQVHTIHMHACTVQTCTSPTPLRGHSQTCT